MQYPAHRRLYDSALFALAARGHEVLLAYDKQDKSSGDPLISDDPSANPRAIGAVPAHGGEWRELLVDLGCTIDYVRFLSSRDGTPYLRMRMDKYLPARAAGLRAAGTWPAPMVRALAAMATFIDRAVPVDSALIDFLRAIEPDALVVTPLVLRGPGGVQQTQLVKAARRLGIPVALAVGSWDHLSSKGFIRVDPDAVIVWNETQKREAVEMHGVPPGRVVVTGAQLFDQWFTMKPTVSREAFLTRVGLPPDRTVILYVGSSRGIAKPELERAFVRRWIEALRASPHPTVREASVLIRPHPGNFESWAAMEWSRLAPVAVWPLQRPAIPMSDAETAEYFHSLYYSAAIVGINTSAMIEAAILDRPVFTVQTPEFSSTQAGTTHFHYLVPEGGGCVQSASTFDHHLAQLGAGLDRPDEGREARARFVAEFVRPGGSTTDATEHVASAIERLVQIRTRRVADRPFWLAPVRAVLRLCARTMRS
jgi:hypothetical protein